MNRAWRACAAWWTAAALAACAPLAAQAQDLSRDPRLLDLAGWQDAPLRPWRTRNAFTRRSLGPEEVRNAQAFVAANLARYRDDADYACRRPALARLFDARLGPRPQAPAQCPDALPFVLASPDAESPLLQLDPARVHAVEYLLAEGNDAPMSRWGHSMLRLVVCAPGRPPGPDCRFDLGEHLVLSFRAFVDDVQVSSWRGLTGSYPSRLFVLPLAQVVTEYTEVELRGLQSIPLRLSREEIAGLLQRAAQVHWSYDGRYAFVGNNCAVETARLLQVGVPRLAAAHLMSVTPTGLLRRLQRAGVTDRSVLDDRAEAMRLGHYFEPADAHQQALYTVARDALALPWTHAEDWLALPAPQRGEPIARADLPAAAALLLMEQLARRRIETRARDEAKRRMGTAGRASARAWLGLESTLTQPAALVPGDGYGLPQAAELAGLEARSAELRARWRQERGRFLSVGRQWLTPALRAELEGAEANLAALQLRLEALGSPAGLGTNAEEAR